MYLLNELLNKVNADDLKFYLRKLNPKIKVTRKAELVSAIEAEFAGYNALKVFESLGDLEQKAVAEAIYSTDLCFDAARLDAKYGAVPSFYSKTKKRGYYSSGSDITLLKVFFYHKPHDYGKMMIPKDLAERLKQSVKRPEALTVKTIHEPVGEKRLSVCDTEFEAIHSVTALLRLAEQGKLKISEKTGMVTQAACKMLLDRLSIKDYFEDEVAFPKQPYAQVIGHIKPIGWLRMLEIAGLFKMVGTKSKLTPAGIKMLGKPAHEIISHIWDKWLFNTKYDEFNRVDAIKGQSKKGHMTAKLHRRDAILDALSECPVGKWIEMSVFSKFMRGSGYELQVSKDECKLYIGDPHYGNFGYSGYGGWEVVEYRYILAFLFEYVATLGLIDVAYVPPGDGIDNYSDQWGTDDLEWLSRYDGLMAFRITALGGYCFGIEDEYQASEQTELNKISISVSPDLTLNVVSGQLEAQHKLLLDTWARQESESVWRLDAMKARDAVERGQDTQGLVDFIESCDDQFIPDTVIGFLRKSESDAKALKKSSDMELFTCRDSKTCDLIAKHKDTAKYCLKCGDAQLVVFSDKLDSFRKAVHAMGLGIV